jgi:hypothetical protein
VNLNERIEILVQLGEYLLADENDWKIVVEKAGRENAWFVPSFVEQATQNIASRYLNRHKLQILATQYPLLHRPLSGKKIGLVMAGNIPLVGFHDFMCCFLSGHQLLVKPSGKDQVLIRHLWQKMAEWNPAISSHIAFADRLNGCDAYIATGSNNTGRYFEYYFKSYASIIRRNRTSRAILTGNETEAELALLADDLLLYFGLGCRNVSKLYVPLGYHFEPLLAAMEKYRWMADHHKYRNNYDYQLSLHILNNKYYMTNGLVLLIEAPSLFSAISQVHYEYYAPNEQPWAQDQEADIQCTIGHGHLAFGAAQQPSILDFADGVDTLQFLTQLQP